jgi:hypothetical protein
MGFLDYSGNTTGKVAFLDKIKVMLSELYTTYVAEIEAARGTDTDLGTRLNTFQDDITLLGNAELPGQTGSAGKLLTTDGSTASWANMHPFSNTTAQEQSHAIALYF